jgi:hypothetical protein
VPLYPGMLKVAKNSMNWIEIEKALENGENPRPDVLDFFSKGQKCVIDGEGDRRHWKPVRKITSRLAY